MNQKNKNSTLLILLVFLNMTAAALYYFKKPDKRILVDEKLFAIDDTSAILKIEIKNRQLRNVLEKKNDRWTINDKFPADVSMMKVILAVLHEVRVKRQAPKNQLDNIKTLLTENGHQIRISRLSGPDLKFTAGGNGFSLSYFMNEDGQVYVVNLPGYDSYVSGIFEVSENDWRDRTLLESSWSGIKNINIIHSSDPGKNLTIRYTTEFFRIDGLTQYDTTRLMDFLDLFSYFFADQFIDPGQITAYDRLASGPPLLSLTVDVISLNDPLNIDFYGKLPGEAVMLGIINGKQMALFSENRMNKILVNKNDFTNP